MFECAVKVALNNCSQDSYIKLCCCIYLAYLASICFYLFFYYFSFTQQFTFLLCQLYFNPATVKMLSNLKVLVIAVLLKMIMKRRFSIIQVTSLILGYCMCDYYSIIHIIMDVSI